MSNDEETWQDLVARIAGGSDNPVSESDSTPVEDSEPDEPDYDFEFESEVLLRGMNEEFHAIEESFKTEEKQLDVLNDEEMVLRKQLTEIARRKAEFSNKTREIRFDMRRLKVTIEDQEHKVEIDKRNVLQRKELKRQQSRFDELTKSAKWRDRALPHQIDGALFMASAKRAICADGMGLGKTLQSQIATDYLGAKKVLIISPGDVVTNFMQEITKWTDKVVVSIARKSKADQQFYLEKVVPNLESCTVILNYESWFQNRKLLTWIQDAGFDTLILDEAHTVKEVKKVPYLGVKAIAAAKNKCGEPGCSVILKAGRQSNYCTTHGYCEAVSSIENLFCMTGTPILNRPQEIFALLHLIQPEIFQTMAGFKRQFCDWAGESWATGGQMMLAEKISGMYIRRDLHSAGIVLPPQEQIIHEIEFDGELYPLQTELMRMLWDDAKMKSKDEEIPVASMLALITRQRQATVWPGGIWINQPILDEFGQSVIDPETDKPTYNRIHIGQGYQESAKMDVAIELYNELTDNGHRVVVFSQFKEALNEFQRRAGDDVCLFTGDVNQADRDIIKRNFDASNGEESKWKGVACHYKPGGQGLNLTAATAMIILDEEWNAGKASQAYDRIHRIGQENKTQVHILRHVGPQPSIDKWLATLIERKKNVVDGFNMSIDDLKNAFE